MLLLKMGKLKMLYECIAWWLNNDNIHECIHQVPLIPCSLLKQHWKPRMASNSQHHCWQLQRATKVWQWTLHTPHYVPPTLCSNITIWQVILHNRSFMHRGWLVVCYYTVDTQLSKPQAMVESLHKWLISRFILQSCWITLIKHTPLLKIL